MYKIALWVVTIAVTAVVVWTVTSTHVAVFVAIFSLVGITTSIAVGKAPGSPSKNTFIVIPSFLDRRSGIEVMTDFQVSLSFLATPPCTYLQRSLRSM